jgi:hypothetical protein
MSVCQQCQVLLWDYLLACHYFLPPLCGCFAEDRSCPVRSRTGALEPFLRLPLNSPGPAYIPAR